MTVNTMTLVCLGISLVCLLLSILIFLWFPSLRCPRITLHTNMFVSLALNNLCWLLWFNLVLFSPAAWSVNAVWCRALHTLTTYFMMSTYAWMLCEGIFLRMFLVQSFLDDERYVKMLCFTGWLMPGVVMLPYVLFRLNYENEKCWINPGSSVWFLAVPVILVFAINIFCLCSVIKIIQSKLQFESNFYVSSPRSMSVPIPMKSIRAVFILIPIFGLQFLLLPIRPPKGSSLEIFYQVFSSLSTSTQGLTVSFLLCFSNDEILTKLRRSFLGFKEKLEVRRITISSVTVFLFVSVFPDEKKKKRRRYSYD